MNIQELREENFKLMQELRQAAMDHDDEAVNIIHELMMVNKDLMLRLELME